MGKGELCRGVNHGDDESHAGGCGSAAHNVTFEDQNLHAFMRAGKSTSGAHDAGAQHNSIVGGGHREIPMQKGSRGSSRSVLSAVT